MSDEPTETYAVECQEARDQPWFGWIADVTREGGRSELTHLIETYPHKYWRLVRIVTTKETVYAT